MWICDVSSVILHWCKNVSFQMSAIQRKIMYDEKTYKTKQTFHTLKADTNQRHYILMKDTYCTNHTHTKHV